MSPLALLLLSIFTVTVALPPKGCMSCLLAPLEERPHSGSSSVSKNFGPNRCFVQTVKCVGRTKESETFIQFNRGSKGVLAPIEQTIELTCSNSGEWEFNHLDFTLKVNSVSCLST
ncbi:unnamed protein product [Caenorhabditis auriculariae]|uniref:C6 domain-containing protein n=1 Tax=Caenorhabditis auriculariae TaxID=2777116 RepID=A0A8S1H757_9PELO|nr:unnamed protein product [Caenorhabditis auriculariae]